jgi:hypothetical protein
VEELWRAFIDRKQEDIMSGMMEFGQPWATANADTGTDPPRRNDGAWVRLGGVDQKVRDRLTEADMAWLGPEQILGDSAEAPSEQDADADRGDGDEGSDVREEEQWVHTTSDNDMDVDG